MKKILFLILPFLILGANSCKAKKCNTLDANSERVSKKQKKKKNMGLFSKKEKRRKKWQNHS